MTDPELHTERVTIMMSVSELASLDEWRFTNRFGSRAAAIRYLVSYGVVHSDPGRMQRKREMDAALAQKAGAA